MWGTQFWGRPQHRGLSTTLRSAQEQTTLEFIILDDNFNKRESVLRNHHSYVSIRAGNRRRISPTQAAQRPTQPSLLRQRRRRERRRHRCAHRQLLLLLACRSARIAMDAATSRSA